MGKRKRKNDDDGPVGNADFKRPRQWPTKQQYMGFRGNNPMFAPGAAYGVMGPQQGSGPMGRPWVDPWIQNSPAIQAMNFQSFEDTPNRIKLMEPESFRVLASRFQVRESDVPSGQSHRGVGRCPRLSRWIWRYFVENQQNTQIFNQKMELWSELERVLRPRLNCTTHVFGSTLNGFASDSSDMDLCLFIDQSDYSSLSHKEAHKCDVNILSSVRKIIRRFCSEYISNQIELIPAKVPILKFYDRLGQIEVDVSTNNPVCIRNTNLLFVYSQVRPIFTFKLLILDPQKTAQFSSWIGEFDLWC